MSVPVGLNVWSRLSYKGRANYAHKQEVLKHHCRDVGRDYDEIDQVVRVGILMAETTHELERLKTQPHIRPMEEGRLVGTPAQVTEALREVITQGAHRLTLHFADSPRPEGTWLFAATVLPRL